MREVDGLICQISKLSSSPTSPPSLNLAQQLEKISLYLPHWTSEGRPVPTFCLLAKVLSATQLAYDLIQLEVYSVRSCSTGSLDLWKTSRASFPA